MSLFAAVFIGGMSAWLINYVEDKNIERELKKMYQDKYGAEWDEDIEPQSMVQWALGYGESPTLYYNEAESQVISGEKRGKVVSMIGSDPRLRKLNKDKDITPEEAMLRREISAEQDFAVEFDDWAEQEMKTHGYNISFREWADEESQSHGDEELLDWAQHEEESHEARYGAESLSFDYTPLAKCDICGGHEQVGYVDDDLSLKVCEHCDVDGADYDPKLLGAESYKPPASAVANAKRGLTLRKEFGRGGLSPSEAKAQGIDSGVTRARKIASGKVSRHDVRRMSAFNRHRKNNNPSKKMPDGGPTAGTIAWLLWGGTSGVNWAKNKSASMNAESEIVVVPECLFCENDDSEEELVEIMLDGYPEMICESCMDPNNWAAESFGPVDEEGILAKALAKARAKSKEPRRPLKITKLPHRNQKSLKDFEADDFGDMEYILLVMLTDEQLEEEYGDFMRNEGVGRKELPQRLQDRYRTGEEAEYLREKYLEPEGPECESCGDTEAKGKTDKYGYFCNTCREEYPEDFEEFNSAIVYQKPKGIIAQVMAKEKALQQLALSEAILELEQYIRLGMISEEDAFKKIVQMSR